MFLLVGIRDVIEVEPAYFLRSQKEASAHEGTAAGGARLSTSGDSSNSSKYELSGHDMVLHRLTERYVGRVVPGRGYCAAIAGIVSATPGVIRGPAGSSWSSVTFEAVLFRPHRNEKIRATIAGQAAEGLYLTLGFYEHIFVPAEALLQPGSTFDAERKLWTYSFLSDDPQSPRTPIATSSSSGGGGGGGGNKEERNDYQTGDEVLFAVKEVVLRDTVSSEHDGSSDEAPMKIIGTFAGSGLGPCAWF
jgi:DNA-directed RNA polymerase III subunit RPC8